MIKPVWKDAPAWASYLAMDGSGQWWWYQRKPILGAVEWKQNVGSAEPANSPVPGWMDTLEEKRYD